MSEFDLSKISHNEPPFETRLDADDLAIALDAAEDNLVLLRADNERLRGGLQLIATDTHRLMNEVARQTAASILGGKPIGATDQPTAAPSACYWTEDEDGNWDTDCEQTWCLMDGKPSENDIKFCHGCGRTMIERLYVEPPCEDDEEVTADPTPVVAVSEFPNQCPTCKVVWPDDLFWCPTCSVPFPRQNER